MQQSNLPNPANNPAQNPLHNPTPNPAQHNLQNLSQNLVQPPINTQGGRNPNQSRYKPKSLERRLIIGIFALIVAVQVLSIVISAVFLHNAHRAEMFSDLERYADNVARNFGNLADLQRITRLDSPYRLTAIDLQGEVLFDSALNSASLDNHLEREEVRNLLQGKSPKAIRLSQSEHKENLYFTRFVEFGTAQNNMDFTKSYPPPNPLRKGGGNKEKSTADLAGENIRSPSPCGRGLGRGICRNETKPQPNENLQGNMREDSEFKDNLAQEMPLQNKPQNLARKLILRVSKEKDSLLFYLKNFAPLFSTLLAFTVVASVLLGVLLTRKIINPIKAINLSHPIKTNPYAELHIFMQRISRQKKKIKKQLKSIKQGRAQLELMSNNISDGFVLLDSAGNVARCNARASAILGLKEGENAFSKFRAFEVAIKQSIDSSNEAFEITLGALFCYVVCMPIFVKSAKNGESLKSTNSAKNAQSLTPANATKSVESKTPKSTKPPLKAIVVLLFDKSLQKDILALRKEFSANVTHELKTPLSSILLSAEMLNSGLVAEGDKAEFIAKIYAESKRLLVLIEKILKISFLDESLEKNANVLEKECVDLAGVIGRILPSIEALGGQKGIKVECDLGEGSLDFAGRKSLESRGKNQDFKQIFEIVGIPALLEDMVYNLCENAIKYSGENGVVMISLKRENSDNSVVLSVADNGIGIALKEQERIFERFYCVDKSRSKNLGGNGLGLAIVKRIAKIHNAKITLKSELGKGSEFVIVFPALLRQG